MMDKIKLKKLMTKVAKGEISQKEVDKLIKSKKVAQIKPNKQNNTHKRKESLKNKENLN